MPASLKANFSTKQIQTFVRDNTRAALYDMGKYAQSRAAKYPKQNPKSTYRRTGTLGRSIAVGNVQKTGNGYRVDVGTRIPYAPAVETGTGIYGPKGGMITPKQAKVLAWVATRGSLNRAGYTGHKLVASGLRKSKGQFKRSRSKDSMMVFAHAVKGFEGWHFMEKAFTGPETKQYFAARLNQLATQLQAKFG